MRISVAFLLFSAIHSLCAAADHLCKQPIVGKVASRQGTWLDETQKLPINKIGFPVCADSLLVRSKGTLKDSDELTIRPEKTDAEVVVYKCSDGVTCSGPLNLKRVPVVRANNSSYDDFLAWVQKHREPFDQDLERLKNFIHKGRVELAEGVVLSKDGRVAIKSLFAGDPPPGQQEMMLEFCAIRPGEICASDAKPIAWDGKAESIHLEPGFYKAVIDKKIGDDVSRTDVQSYILAVPDQATLGRLGDLYRKQAGKTDQAEDSEEARRKLIAYLYFLSGGYDESAAAVSGPR